MSRSRCVPSPGQTLSGRRAGYPGSVAGPVGAWLSRCKCLGHGALRVRIRRPLGGVPACPRGWLQDAFCASFCAVAYFGSARSFEETVFVILPEAAQRYDKTQLLFVHGSPSSACTHRFLGIGRVGRCCATFPSPSPSPPPRRHGATYGRNLWPNLWRNLWRNLWPNPWAQPTGATDGASYGATYERTQWRNRWRNPWYASSVNVCPARCCTRRRI